MKMFIGHIRCPSCGFTHIVDSRQIVIYYNFDMRHQIAEVVCFNCKQVVSSTIDEADVYSFSARGVKLVPWQTKLPPLTESDIDNWDIEEELNGVN